MIIIPLQGGLGNQLFQYAFGRLLEKRCGAEVLYDTCFFDNPGKYTKRKYALDVFSVSARLATKEESDSIKYPLGILSKALYTLHKGLNKYFLKRYHVGYTDGLVESLSGKGSFYVEGYFQSFEYVLPIIDTLKQDFSLKGSPSGELSKLIADLKMNNSALVHIRRGDYLTKSGMGKQELTSLDKSYYAAALHLLREKLGDISLCIYTDDVSWVKSEMGDLFGEKCIYASDYNLRDYEEFYSMRFASHYVIANSSFSWWGAMLTESDGSVIIAPKDWRNIYFKDMSRLCPPEWILV